VRRGRKITSGGSKAYGSRKQSPRGYSVSSGG